MVGCFFELINLYVCYCFLQGIYVAINAESELPAAAAHKWLLLRCPPLAFEYLEHFLERGGRHRHGVHFLQPKLQY